MSTPTRRCSTVPTEEEVVKAYQVLGVATSGTYADVRRRYVDLAKEHHPDIVGAAGPTSATATGGSSEAGNPGSRMVEINNAYSTVSRFHKAGRKLSSAHTSASSSSTGSSSSPSWRTGSYYQQRHPQQNWYSGEDRGYQPWHEDLDPLLYEMMWEEMRRQNASDPFARAMEPDEFYAYAQEKTPRDYGKGSYRPKRPQSHRQDRNGGSGDQRSGDAADGKTNSSRERAKSTTWSEADLQALVNMYQDGKSFEFIGNALGKEPGKVIEEFNRWSDDMRRGARSNARSDKNNRDGRRNKRQHLSRGPFYHMEYPAGPPYGFYDFMIDDEGFDNGVADDEDGDPYGYHTGEDYSHFEDPWQMDEDGPAPYNGTHRMSGARGGIPHTHRTASPGGSGGNGNFQGNRSANHNGTNRAKSNFSRNIYSRNAKSRGKR